MTDGNGQHLARLTRISKRSVYILHANLHRLADILKADVAHQRSRKQARFTENLETIANTEYQTAALSELLHRLHHGRKLGNRAGTQIIPISKTARHDDGITVLQVV